MRGHLGSVPLLLGLARGLARAVGVMAELCRQGPIRRPVRFR